MSVEEIAPGVFVETAYHLANVGCIVTGEGVFLVDAPFVPSEARHWGAFVRSQGKPRYFVPTHAHPDHIGGHGFFAEAEMICHESIEDQFARYPAHLEEFLPRVGLPDDVDFSGFTMREPSLTFSDRLTIRLGGRRIELLSADGHTRRHTMVWLPEEGVLFSGDNVVNQWPPMCHEGDIGGWYETLDRIHGEIRPRRIVPGHGPVCDAAFTRKVRETLKDVEARVRSGISEGRSREEIAESIRYLDPFGVPEWFAEHADRMRKLSVGVIYDYVKEQG
ncbi:MAG: MBL fold metallo-hydrolase [Nitrospinota bacterium]